MRDCIIFESIYNYTAVFFFFAQDVLHGATHLTILPRSLSIGQGCVCCWFLSANRCEVPSLTVLEFTQEFCGGVMKTKECHLSDVTLRWNPDTFPEPPDLPIKHVSHLHLAFFFVNVKYYK